MGSSWVRRVIYYLIDITPVPSIDGSPVSTLSSKDNCVPSILSLGHLEVFTLVTSLIGEVQTVTKPGAPSRQFWDRQCTLVFFHCLREKFLNCFAVPLACSSNNNGCNLLSMYYVHVLSSQQFFL